MPASRRGCDALIATFWSRILIVPKYNSIVPATTTVRLNTADKKELLNIVGNSITHKDFFNEAIETRFQSFKSQMNSFKASQAERLVAGNSSSFQNLLYLSHFDYCERLVLNSMKLATAMKKFFVS